MLDDKLLRKGILQQTHHSCYSIHRKYQGVQRYKTLLSFAYYEKDCSYIASMSDGYDRGSVIDHVILSLLLLKWKRKGDMDIMDIVTGFFKSPDVERMPHG